MKRILIVLVLGFTASLAIAQNEDKTEVKRVISRVDTSTNRELVLIQEFTVNSPITTVWEAYTTKSGWESWAVPMAEIDLRVGGTIKSNYNKAGTIGDSTTVVIHIINYVPKTLITLQAEITENFPEFMKAEEKDFYNVIYFQEAGEGKTAVKSYGIGYKNTPRYLSLMEYFIAGNEMSLMNLIYYLEKGIKTKYE